MTYLHEFDKQELENKKKPEKEDAKTNGTLAVRAEDDLKSDEGGDDLETGVANANPVNPGTPETFCKFVHTAPKTSAVTPLQPRKRSSPGPSRRQKDDALALANITKLLQPKKKITTPPKPGPTFLRYEAPPAREKNNEG